MGFFYDTFLDRWPPAVAALSIPTVHHLLPESDVLALLSQCPYTRGLSGQTTRAAFSDETLAWVDRALQCFPGGAFPRLGACSFVTANRPAAPVRARGQVVKLLMHPGRRAVSMVWRCLQGRQPVALCLREWRDIPPASEFRVFIQQRKVVGISQYHWRCVFSEMEQALAAVRKTMHDAAETIAAVSHLADVVADIFVTDSHWMLVELNPACDFSSSCLFSPESPFDGTLRYLDADAQPRAISLE